MSKQWIEAQIWEGAWWGNCLNTWQEEQKQIVYAQKMRLTPMPISGKYPVINMYNESIIDIGGGPASLLLKCINLGIAAVYDPLPYPQWVSDRYRAAGISLISVAGEEIATDLGKVDEVWIYNCLQHVQDPERVIRNAMNIGELVRIFEWLEVPKDTGHIHVLHEDILNTWLGGQGKVEMLDERGCHGLAYYGCFPSKI